MNELKPSHVKTAIREFNNSKGDGADGGILIMFDMDHEKLASASWGRRKRDCAALKEVLDEIMDMLFTGEISVGPQENDAPAGNRYDGYDMIG